MGNPTTTILDFDIREDTYIKKSLPKVKAWHRAQERARRSFYKYVGKKGYYGELIYEKQWYGEYCYYRAPWGGYLHGIPQWRAIRSQIRDQWERKFTRHCEAVRAEVDRIGREEQARRLDAWKRVYAVRYGRHSQILTMQRGVTAIHQYAANKH